MPKAKPDRALLEAIEAVVNSVAGNESEAARKLGVSRVKIHRIRKQRGAAIPAVQQDLWQRIKKITTDSEISTSDTVNSEVIYGASDVQNIAIQVLRYIADVIEREIQSECRPEPQWDQDQRIMQTD